MVRKNAVYLFTCFFATLVQERVLAQYMNGNLRSSCSYQNLPIQRNLPINLPMRNSWALSNLPSANDRLRLPNYACPCNENPAPAPVYNDLQLSRMNPEDRIALRNNLLSNLKVAASNLLPIAEKISILYNLISANRDPGNSNVSVRKLNVPIVNDVPMGAIRVARNLPIAKFETTSPIARVSNGVQVLGRGQINYQNIGGIPLNSIAQLPIGNFRNIPLNKILNAPSNAPSPIMRKYYVNNIGRNPVSKLETISYQNLANSPFNTIQRRSIFNQPYLQNNLPNYTPSISFQNIIDQLRFADRSSLPIGNQIAPVNNLSNLQRAILAVDKMGRLNLSNLATPSVTNSLGALASSGPGRVLTNVPVVPYNSIAKLPAYNGLPVIKVSESVYRLTPAK